MDQSGINDMSRCTKAQLVSVSLLSYPSCICSKVFNIRCSTSSTRHLSLTCACVCHKKMDTPNLPKLPEFIWKMTTAPWDFPWNPLATGARLALDFRIHVGWSIWLLSPHLGPAGPMGIHIVGSKNLGT